MREKDHLDTRAPRVSPAGNGSGSSGAAERVSQWRDNGGFEAGIELALRSILVSPKFIFRFEAQPPKCGANTPYRVSDIELASRLSFFLWSSIPDEALLDVAAKNTLHRPEVLQQQVKRMLADPRSQALVENFAGQWLHLRNVEVHQPSPELLFHFDDNLRKAFEQETQLFFESIIREDRSVVDLLDANYTFLNERLARHYGIRRLRRRFRRVSLPADSPRGGLLGQGSILMATSYPNRTSPVIRGKWILENVFGAPPPPPPPNVPELKDSETRARCCRCANSWRRTARIPRAQAATRRWISWGLRSRTSTGLASGATLRFGREGRRIGSAARRHEVQRAGRPPKGAADALGRVPDDGNGKTVDLCPRARARGERCAGGPED